MAIVWDKPTITARDITRILIQQYGPENPTRILVDDDTKPINYNSSLVNCECLRCGKRFSYTPSAIVNALYYNGYVCNTCGMLSDTELQDQQKEEMRVGTLKLLKENGIDVVQEAIDAEKEKKEAAEDEDYNDALHDAYNEANTETKSVESSNPVIEEKHEEIKETPVEKVNEDVVKPVEKKIEKKPEVKKEVKQEPVKEKKVTEKPVEKKNDYMVSDEDYNGSIGDQVKDEVEIAEEDEIPDDTGDDITEDDVFGVEEPEESDEVEEVAKALNNNKQTEKSTESIQSEVVEPEVKEVEQPEEKKEDKDPDFVWIGTNAYTEDELQKVLKEKMDNIVKKIHFNPYDPDTFEINEDADLSVKCRTCGQTVLTEDVDTLDNVESLSDVCKRYGKDLPVGKNNYRNIEPMLYSCPTCTSEILTKGYNSYHKKLVEDICQKAHINILDKNHLYINDPNEELRVECNGVIKILKFNLILSKFGRGQDARNDPMFENKDQTKKVEVKTEEVKSTESVKPETENDEKPVVTNTDSENKIKIVQERVNFTENVTEVPNDSKPVVREAEPEKPKVVLRPKTTEVLKRDPVKEPERVTLHAKAPEPTQEQKSKLNQFDGHINEHRKPVFSKRENTNNNSAYGSMFNSERAKDSNANLEEERAYNERQLNKHKIFSESSSLKTAKKNIAKLTGTENPFEREISLKQEFDETVFADFIKELSNKTGVDYKLILDERSYEIPVVDFENGTRIICSNLDEPGLANVKYEWLNRVPFSWKEDIAEDDGTGRLRRKPKSFKWVVLFSDSIEFAKDATFSALIKYINPSVLAYDGKKIVLQDNLIIQYTKNQQYLRDFDKRNSTFPSKKPATGSIGIIARWNSTSKATARDVLKLRMQMEGRNTNVNNLDTLASDYSEYMAASIKYVEHMNPETNRVIYTITEYVEVGSSIIADGFAQCVRALLKEYFKKYPQLMGVPPYIIVEIDPNTFPSPALHSYIERGTLCKMDNSYKMIVEGSKANLNAVDKSLRYSYIRRPEYRQGSDLDRMRQDRRMFNAGTLIVRMSNEIKQAGLSNTIRNPEVRKAFIENMGYIEATQAEIKQYFVNQSIIAAMMSDGYTARLTERIDENMFNSSKMVSDSNSGFGMNNVLMNPAAMMKYNSIMQNGSPEAKDYFMRMMREDYQQKMQDYMMQNQGTQGKVFSQNPQQNMFNNPMMNNVGMNNFGFGMNPMMGMEFGMGMQH